MSRKGRSEYSIYKSGGQWRGRFFWDEKTGKYLVSEKLNIPVEGRWERRADAEAAAVALLKTLKPPESHAQKTERPLCDTPFVAYLSHFWGPESEYLRDMAVVKKMPLSGAYIENNLINIRLYIAPYPGFEGVTVGSFSRAHIRPYTIWLSEVCPSGDKINKVLKTIRTALSDAALNGVIPANPFNKNDKAYHKERERGILTPAETQALIASPVANIYHRLAVLLAIRCSMRRGEIRGLQWGDIGDGVITVQHNFVEVDGMKNPKTKGGKVQENTRTVAIPADVQALLDAAHKLARGMYVIESLRRHGDPVSGKYFDHAIKRELEGIGITLEQQKSRNLVFHGGRHTGVTLGLKAGISSLDMSAMAGHGVKTQQKYNHADQAIDFAEMREKLERGIG